MAKVKAYYTANRIRDGVFVVQKYTPDFDPDGKAYTVTHLPTGGHICSCVARIDKCRHVLMTEKFPDGIKGYYDYDHDSFYEPPANSWLNNLEA